MSNTKEKLKKIWIEYYKDSKWFRPEREPSGDDLQELLTEGNIVYEEKTSSSRWWDNLERVTELEGKYFRYNWATTTGDNSIWDVGWEFDWNTLVEVEPYQETIIVTKYRPK